MEADETHLEAAERETVVAGLTQDHIFDILERGKGKVTIDIDCVSAGSLLDATSRK